jgi:hypothetical protein
LSHGATLALFEAADAFARAGPDPHRPVAPLAAQQAEPAVLRAVGVLVLVHQQVAERPLVALEHLGEELEHVHGPKEQVVEVHGVHGVAALLVELVHVGHGLLEEGGDALAVRVGADRR